MNKHSKFQKELSDKQLMYDSIFEIGKSLQSKAPKSDEPIIKQMLTDSLRFQSCNNFWE